MTDIKPELLSRVDRLRSELDSLAAYIAGKERISDGDEPKSRARPILGLYYESVGDGGFRRGDAIGGNRPPMEAVILLRRIFSHVIFRFPWPRFLKSKDPFDLDWDLLESDLATFYTNDYQIIFARHGVPAAATVDGMPSHEIYEHGCLLQDTWEYAAGQADPSRNREWCVNPRRALPNPLRRLAGMLARRFPPQVIAGWIAGPNEPDDPLFNALAYLANTGRMSHDQVVEFTMEDQIVPFTQGVQDVCPDAHFFGPEAAGASALERYLDYERSKNLRVFQTITSHLGYSWDKSNGHPIEDGIRRLNEALPILAEYANGREHWNTEFRERSGQGRHAEMARMALALPFNRAFFFHDWPLLFDKDAQQATTPKWIPNRTFAELQGLAAEINS